MLDKAKLGTRFVCFECQCKFYDLNREVPTCPDCGADQREAPDQDIRNLLGKGKGRKSIPREPNVPDLDDDDDDDRDDDDDDDLGLLDDDDDDGDDDDDDMDDDDDE